MYLLIKQALISDILEDLREASDTLLIDIKTDDFFHPELYPYFDGVSVYDSDWDVESLKVFIQDYSAFLLEMLEDDELEKPERIGILARLYVLGSIEDFNTSMVPFPLVEYLLNEEIPEEFHLWMDEALAKQKAYWPDYAKHKLNTSQLILLYLDQDDVIGNGNYCVHLSNPQGELLYSNLNGFKLAPTMLEASFSIWVNPSRLTIHNRLTDPSPSACLIRTLNLPDGGKLLLGEAINRNYQVIQGLSQLLIMGLVSIFLLALICGYWVASRAVRKLTLINEVCDRISQGELSLRIPEYQSDDDYDKLACHINTMLNRISELMESVKRVSDNIAHDLKTPLAHMQNQLNQVLQSTKPSRADIQKIFNENERIIQCFNALLRISEVEQGGQRQAFSPFNFSDIVATLSDLYEPAMEQKRIRFHVENQASKSLVFGDKHQWLQALANLLDNAVKFSPAGGEIRIEIVQVEQTLRITMKDSGPGIPLTKQNDVFDRFYRLDNHRSTPGFGLGLSLVKAVCKVHDSHMELKNEKGLVVTLFLALLTQD